MEVIANTPPLVEIKERKAWAAVILNIFLRPIGYVYLGEWKRGLLIFLIITFLDILIIVLYSFIPFHLWFPCIAVYTIAVFIFVIKDSIYLAKKKGKDYILKPYNKWYLYLFIIIFLMLFSEIKDVLIFDMFVQSYATPTGSMENTVLVGDRFFVNKAAYGLQFAPFNKYILKYNKPSCGDIVVFIFPGFRDDIAPEENVTYFKRLIGEPGDEVKIIKGLILINNKIYNDPPSSIKTDLNYIYNNNPDIFPKGSKWNEDDYGPIRVPRSGDTLKIDSANFEQWEVFIARDAGKVERESDGFFKNIINKGYYKVKKDYCFVIGDNRRNSLDSRFWGFVPIESIIGKVDRIYFSYNPGMKDFFYSIRWNRIGLEVK